jgi:hypothetical protein
MYGVRYGPVMNVCKNGNEVSGSTKMGLAELLVTYQKEVLYGITKNKK